MASVACNPQNLQKRTRSALIARVNKAPSKSEMRRWTLYSQKIFYKAASDAKEAPPDITRQLGAWAPVAWDTPYSRMNEAQITKNRKRIVNSNDKFLEITWWYQDGANNHRSSTQKGPTQSDKAKNKSLVPIILEHGDQRTELNPKIIPLPFATSFTTIYPEISLAFELCHR